MGRPYNGFSAEQRARGDVFLRGIAWPRPKGPCESCGQTVGVGAHAEDYSEPFGPHLWAFSLCFACHMSVHTRDSNPRAAGRFIQYVSQLNAGIRLPPIPNWADFCVWLNTPARFAKLGEECPPLSGTVLLEIDRGFHNPNHPNYQGVQRLGEPACQQLGLFNT